MQIVQLDIAKDNLISLLRDKLSSLKSDDLVLITKDDIALQFSESEINELYEEKGSAIVFAASADFPFHVEGINLYYWKYYPREQGTYHYVYSNMILGKANSLLQLLEEMIEAYGQELVEKSLTNQSEEVDTFHRFYLDTILGLNSTELSVSLDRDQQFFGVSEGRRSVIKWPVFSLRHGFIFHKYEKRILGDLKIGTNEWDLVKRKDKIYNKRLKITPAILSQPEIKKGGFGGVFKSLIAYLHSLGTLIKIFIFNGGKRKDHQIFRFRHNQNPDINKNIEKLIGNLEQGQAFSFTHFNDGEMTFIKKYKEQDHREVWFGGAFFGRIQDKYNKALGELLEAAFLKRQDHYYIGIPCPISHPKLSDYAKELRPVDEFTIPAMTFHHNLSKYPRILGAIRNKKVYFVVNIHQDLTFFKRMGFQFNDDQIIRVPFRSAHEEYNKIKERTFEEGSIVLLMSGMLAKILCAYWFEHNPKTTFIAFGSSFDDYIQSNIKFNLYPKEFPFAKTLLGSRYYLFGRKPTCKGCYDMSQPLKLD